jgi:hypothetical protein
MTEDLLRLDRALTPAERRRVFRKMGKGYASPPGTGPKDETCRSCAHFTRKRMSKTYRKCALTQTGGAATDILAGSPACRQWRKPDGPGDRADD